MKKFLTLFAAAALALTAVVSCNKDEKEDEVIKLKSIELSQSSLTLAVGDEATLIVTYKPADATDKPAATWSSSDAAIASVAEGKVTAVAAGTATITAKVGEFTATCAVTVNETAEDLNGAWSVIGKFNDWAGDVAMTQGADGWYVAENVTLTGVTSTSDGFKFRRDKDWGTNLGLAGDAAVVELDKELALELGGGNICLAKDAVYNLYLNPNAKLAKVVYVKDIEEPKPTDFTSPNWDEVPGMSNGTHGMFKFTTDNEYAYFYHWRTTEGRYSALWGEGQGYIYFAFDLDDDLSTGEALNDNGNYEYIAFTYCFGGTAEDPWIGITKEGDVRPSTYTLDNLIVKGSVDENGAYVEYRLPLADLPALPEKYTIYTWGNKDLAKIAYPVPYVEPGPEEPQVDWDYTPSAEYTDASNLWKAVDAANTTEWFYNPEWAGEQEPPVTTFKESTWEIWNKVATTESWQAQLWIHPTTDFLLDISKKYTFSCKVYATEATPVYIKMYQKGVDAALSFDVPRATIPAATPIEVKIEDFVPLATPQCILIDFGGIPANTKVFVKDIVLKVTGEVAPPVTWDYTPGDEYLAENNLWKAKAAGHEKYYYYNATGGDWNGSDVISETVPFLTVNQSTYELNYPEATNELWQKQFFIFPAAGNEIALAADKTYKLKVTLGTNQPNSPGFFKLSKFDAGNTTKHEGATIWEKGNVTLAGAEPLVIESPEITGAECDNIILIFAFGGNPADTKVYIKDITLVEVVVAPPAEGNTGEDLDDPVDINPWK